eukprot:7288220-Alexandrium_andersonii.AAC.1
MVRVRSRALLVAAQLVWRWLAARPPGGRVRRVPPVMCSTSQWMLAPHAGGRLLVRGLTGPRWTAPAAPAPPRVPARTRVPR